MTHHKRCPVRSVVRTSDFHSGNRGSIPLRGTTIGRIAQLGEHLPYKQGVIGSSPIVTTIHTFGGVAQLVRAPACHAGGREFDPRHSRHFYFLLTVNAQIAQSVEQGTENPRVGGSIPPLGTTKNI